jgi:hypothetical protein
VKLDKQTAEAIGQIFNQAEQYKPVNPAQLTRVILYHEDRLDLDDEGCIAPGSAKDLVKFLVTSEPNLFTNTDPGGNNNKQPEDLEAAKKRAREMLGYK